MAKRYKKLIFFILIFTILMATYAFASNNIYKPYNVNVTFYGISENTRAITWQTDNDTKSVIYYKNQDGIIKEKTGYSTKINLDNTTYYTHRVVLDDLLYDTLYQYSINDKNDFKYSFKTNKDSKDDKIEPFTFLAFSDNQSLDKDYKKYIGYSLNNSLTGFSEISFIAFLGDMIDVSNRSQWNHFFDATKDNMPNYTIAPLIGNHENARGGTSLFNSNFTLNDTYYSFVYENALFISLNTDGDIEKQIKFIEDEVSKNNKQWNIVFMHKGIYGGTHSKDTDVTELREKLTPVFDANNIDLVLQGHDHTYQRMNFMKDKKIVTNKNIDETYVNPKGTLYIVSGATGSKRYPFAKYSWVYKSWTPKDADIDKPNKKVFNQVTIDNNKLTYNAYTSDFEKVDSVTIIK